jgi:hypothetical protein
MTRQKSPGAARSETKSKPENTTQSARERRLTDAYSAEARRDTLRQGDELSELEPVGRKADEATDRAKGGSGGAAGRTKLAGNKTSGTGRR